MPFHTYKGQPSTRPAQTSNTFSQASTRHGMTSFDQHGRKLSWTADKRSGMPAGPIGFDFSAPWYPDQNYIRINPDDASQAYIDYAAMFRDRKSALRGYHAEAVDFARRGKQPIPKLGHYTDDIIGVVGKPPRALELIAAAAQEHPWVLGFDDREDERLLPFLETPSTDIEAELEEFDFSLASYNEQMAGEEPRRPKKPFPQQRFSSVDELEAAADDLGEQHEEDLSGFGEMGATTGDEDEDEDVDLVDDVEDGPPESIPTDAEGAEARLLDIEEEHDPEARGGQRVDPRKADIAKRQGARRPSQTAVPRKRATERSAGKQAAPAAEKASRGGRAWDAEAAKGRSLADGAKPYTG